MPLALPSSPPPSIGLDVQVNLEALPALQDLAPIWQHLEARADRSFFLSWTWIETWLKTIDCRPKLLVARSKGEVVGLALVHAVLKKRHRIMPVWTLFLNQTGNDREDVITTEYNDILLDRREADGIRHACLRFLIEHRYVDGREVDELQLGGISGHLREPIGKLGRPIQERAACGSAFISLSKLRRQGLSFLDSLGGSTARRIRRSQTLYRRRGDIELRTASDPDEALLFFENAGQLHQARWKARGHPGAFAYPFYVSFHQELIRTAIPLGQVELVRLSVGQELLGYLYNFLDRGRVHYYFSGFRFDDDNRLKPGLVCHAHCIEHHLAGGMDVYDFMGGDQRYKLELGRPGPEILTLAVQLPNWKLAAERPLRRLKNALGAVRSR